MVSVAVRGGVSYPQPEALLKSLVLAAKHRLRLQSDIVAVLRRGRRLNTPLVTIYYLDKPQADFRVAVVVGKKVSALAVRRHRYKRWLRELIKSHASQLSAIDMVVVAKPDISRISSLPELRQGLSPVFGSLEKS